MNGWEDLRPGETSHARVLTPEYTYVARVFDVYFAMLLQVHAFSFAAPCRRPQLLLVVFLSLFLSSFVHQRSCNALFFATMLMMRHGRQ